MAKNFKDDDVQDNDPTDELPILTDAVLEAERERASARPPSVDDEDTSSYGVTTIRANAAPAQTPAAASRREKDGRIGALESEFASLERRWQETRAELAERETELASLRALLDEREARLTELAESVARTKASLQERDAQIASLTAALEAAQSNVDTLEDTARSLEQQIVVLDTTRQEPGKRNVQARGVDATQQLREALASLSQHIENRNGVWRRQLAEVEQKTTRIHELEIELAQRQARQHAAERHAELQAAHAQQLRARLTPPRDVAVAGDERAAVSAGSSTPDQLREELRREIELQSELGDGAESLRRLRELEGAIRTLEQQMDAGDGTAELPEPVPEPARLVCLTGDELGSLALEKTGVTIGRGSHCGIRIATHYVSREHARLTTSNGRWIIEDLGSRNGVFVNAVRIERQVLDDKDLITIGDTQFRYQSGSVPSR